ncbi:hypothetical protein HALLA_11495 [Halostagnicola larsenii XH-48]|uniref:Uncharacterized protein n=1 Tax=Halostagnicola larsenii XH-48 TaxID=797299 RepID=W0JUB4_9EURY|nr:hypothetical protein [Halostagnicola larsenii]AHG00892.1 hypothetical protein HALLA_11495 [Halostagnicola larsenii XH-48]
MSRDISKNVNHQQVFAQSVYEYNMKERRGWSFFYAVLLDLLVFSADLAINGNTFHKASWWVVTLTLGGLLVWSLLTDERTST